MADKKNKANVTDEQIKLSPLYPSEERLKTHILRTRVISPEIVSLNIALMILSQRHEGIFIGHNKMQRQSEQYTVSLQSSNK